MSVRALTRCSCALLIGVLYGFAAADLVPSEAAWMLVGVFVTTAIVFGLVLLRVIVVHLVTGMALRPETAIRPSRHTVFVALIVATVLAFPVAASWSGASGARSGVLPLAELVRAEAGIGDAVWVYASPDSRSFG